MRISTIEYYLPDDILDNQQLVDKFGFDKEFIEKKLGILKRHRAKENQAAHALGHEAVSRLLSKHNIAPESIGLLMGVSQNADYKLPHFAALIQDSVGFPTTIASFDLNLGCSGFVYSLAVAKGLMTTIGYERVIIVTSDPYSKMLFNGDRTTVPLFGDAASAVLIEKHSDSYFGAFDLGTDGSGANALRIKRGGSLFPNTGKDDIENYIKMDGRAIFNFMMKTVPLSINRCLGKNRKKLDDIDFFVFHQASKYMLETLQKRLKIPREKMIINMQHCGNTASSSIPIALEPLLNVSKNRGKTVLLSGFGVGLSWATVIIKL